MDLSGLNTYILNTITALNVDPTTYNLTAASWNTLASEYASGIPTNSSLGFGDSDSITWGVFFEALSTYVNNGGIVGSSIQGKSTPGNPIYLGPPIYAGTAGNGGPTYLGPPIYYSPSPINLPISPIVYEVSNPQTSTPTTPTNTIQGNQSHNRFQ